MHLCHHPVVDYSQTWSKLSPLPRAQGASGTVGHVCSWCHPALHQGVVSTGGRACHFLQIAQGYESISVELIKRSCLNCATRDTAGHVQLRNWFIKFTPFVSLHHTMCRRWVTESAIRSYSTTAFPLPGMLSFPTQVQLVCFIWAVLDKWLGVT